MSAWKLESAKARLSELVRQARESGPQTITVRGRDTAVVLSAEDYRRLTSPPGGETWVDRIRSGLTVEFDFERDPGGARDLDL